MSISDDIKTYMKFNEYLSLLMRLAEKHPDMLDTPVIASGDSEGNHYHRVAFAPSFGKLSGGTEFDPYDRKICKKNDINAVCIN